MPTSARITNATSTSSSEKPRDGRGRRACARRGGVGAPAAQSRIATRPVSQSTSTLNLRSPTASVTRPPFEPPSGKEADRADLVADEIALRGEELELDLPRQRVRARDRARPGTIAARGRGRRGFPSAWRALRSARARSPAATSRAAPFSSAVDTPPPKIGTTIAAMIAMIDSTIRSSSSVTPRARRRAERAAVRAARRCVIAASSGCPCSAPRRLPCRRRRAKGSRRARSAPARRTCTRCPTDPSAPSTSSSTGRSSSSRRPAP